LAVFAAGDFRKKIGERRNLDCFLAILEQTRQQYRFVVVG
jgi:hypothetical protein